MALVDLEQCSQPQLDALRSRLALLRRVETLPAGGTSGGHDDLDALRVEVARSPCVLAWLFEQQGTLLDGVLTLEGWYDAFAARLLTAQPGALLLAGRDAEAAQLVARLSGPPERIELVASEHEALAFAAAVLQHAPAQLVRSLLVTSQPGWELLCKSTRPLVLVASSAMPFDVPAALAAGHHVIWLRDRALSGSAAVSLVLPAAPLSVLGQALAESGVSADARASLARLGQQSLWALLCALDADPSARRPWWSHEPPSDAVLALVCAGHLDARFEADVPIVAQLAGLDVGALRTELEALGAGEAPLVRVRGEVSHTLSRSDAFCWLASHITPARLDRLGRAWEAAIASRLAPEHLLLAGRPPLLPEGTCSPWLVEGLSGSLCLLVAQQGEGSEERQRFVDACVSSLCAQLVSVRHWVAMLGALPLLAEAAPEIVLRAVEEASDGPAPLLAGLLAPGASVLARAAPRPLLSALEVVAQIPSHTWRVVRLLGRLAHIELTKRGHGSSAIASLTRLLRVDDCPLPASWASRCQMLDALRQSEPDVGWALMLALVPAAPQMLTPAARPRHRVLRVDAADEDVPVERAREQLLARLLHDGHASPGRLASLVALLETLPQSGCDLLVRELMALDPGVLRDQEREQLRASLRALITRFRAGSDENWLLAESQCTELRRVYDHLDPRDLVDRHGWLFDHRPLLLEGQKAEPHEHAVLSAKAQRSAVVAIWKAAGLDGVVRLAARAPAPLLVGQALAQSPMAADAEPHLLALGQLGLDESERRLVQGFWAGRRKTGGRTWAEQIISRPGWQRWPVRSKRDFFLVMPFAAETWTALASSGDQVARAYWQAIDPSEREDVSPDVRVRVACELAEVGELSRAFAWLLTSPAEVDDGLFEQLAFALLDRLARSDRMLTERVLGELRIESVFAALGDKQVQDLVRFERLEWLFLDRIAPAIRPRALGLALAHDPTRFVEMLSLAYGGEGTTEPDEQRRALLLLASWNHLPGAGEDGLLDIEPLRRWVRRARTLACAAGLLSEADEHIGRQLILSPQGRDGLLLHEAIRDLVETLGSEAMLSALAQTLQGDPLRVLTRTGVDPRKPRRFVAYCRRAVEAFSPRWPRTASALRSVADALEQRQLALNNG